MPGIKFILLIYSYCSFYSEWHIWTLSEEAKTIEWFVACPYMKTMQTFLFTSIFYIHHWRLGLDLFIFSCWIYSSGCISVLDMVNIPYLIRTGYVNEVIGRPSWSLLRRCDRNTKITFTLLTQWNTIFINRSAMVCFVSWNTRVLLNGKTRCVSFLDVCRITGPTRHWIIRAWPIRVWER